MFNNDSVTLEIKKLLEKLQTKAQKIGDYVSHDETEEGNIRVSLSNGRIMLHSAEVKDATRLPDFRLQDIIARFQPTKSGTIF